MSPKPGFAARVAVVGRRPARTPAEGTGNIRTKDVRLTFDISPRMHRDLTRYCADLADEIGATRVPAAAVIRALLTQLHEKPELQEEIRNTVMTALRQ